MEKSKKLKTIILAIIIILLLRVSIFIIKYFIKIDNDYKKLGLDIDYSDIKYYTIYEDDVFEKYKVYKIHNECMEDLKIQLENSKLWSKDKYYEYIMDEFYDISDDDDAFN